MAKIDKRNKLDEAVFDYWVGAIDVQIIILDEIVRLAQSLRLSQSKIQKLFLKSYIYV